MASTWPAHAFLLIPSLPWLDRRVTLGGVEAAAVRRARKEVEVPPASSLSDLRVRFMSEGAEPPFRARLHTAV